MVLTVSDVLQNSATRFIKFPQTKPHSEPGAFGFPEGLGWNLVIQPWIDFCFD